ncbi:MAG: hypothetical protein QW692_01710 [Nitrososphaerota archaeon]
MSGKASRKGLSPLLAIIIGLVVTIVAGILLAQLYFSYASTMSIRPAANIEYVDVVTDGTTSILAISIKNMGNVPIIGGGVTVDNTQLGDCNIGNIPVGGVGGCSAQLPQARQPGTTVVGSVMINFDVDGDGRADSSQVYAFSVRARSA